MVKIQNDQARELIVFEKNSDADLRLNIKEGTNDVDDDNDPMTYQACREMHKKWRRLDDVYYGNLDVILGSAAVVERLWSISDTIVNDKRNSISSLLIEILLFLRENRYYWDIQLVKEGFNVTRS